MPEIVTFFFNYEIVEVSLKKLVKTKQLLKKRISSYFVLMTLKKKFFFYYLFYVFKKFILFICIKFFKNIKNLRIL